MSRPHLGNATDVVSTVTLAVLAVAVLVGTALVLTRTPTTPTGDDRPSSASSKTPSPSARATPTDRDTDQPTTRSLSAARDVVASDEPVNVLIVGDESGSALNEWVAGWGRSLNDQRTVTQRQWNFKKEQFAPTSSRLGGEGPELTIWNLSQPGARADYPASRLAEVGEEPDLVLYSFSRNNKSNDIGDQLLTTTDAIAAEWGEVPGVLVLPNPAADDSAKQRQATVTYLRSTWAPENRVPAIDVWQAFKQDDRPLKSLLLDGSQPNRKGTQLWVDAVARSLN